MIIFPANNILDDTTNHKMSLSPDEESFEQTWREDELNRTGNDVGCLKLKVGQQKWNTSVILTQNYMKLLNFIDVLSQCQSKVYVLTIHLNLGRSIHLNPPNNGVSAAR